MSADCTRLALIAIATALLLAAPAAQAAPVTGVLGDAFVTAKKKPKKCKKGQVRVRVRKRVSCLSAKKALPKPKAGDPRLLLARSVYARDWSRVRNRRGKRARSLPKLIRKLGPRAPRLLARVTSRALTRAGSARARAAANGCDAPKGATKKDTFTSDGGDGTKAKVTSTLGSEGVALGMELTGNGMTVAFDLDFGCEPDEVLAPNCPTAVGQLEGQIGYRMRATVTVSKGGEELWSQGVATSRKTRLVGWTDDDAKLDRLDIDDVETSNITLGGSVRGYPPISVRTKVTRKTQVDMRTGAYEPDRSDINVTITAEGFYGPERAEEEDAAAERARADADKQFRSIVAKAIEAYRTRERAWNDQPNTCAKLQFSPASNTRRLRAGEAGSFTATAIANQGGGASQLDARLSAPANASFSPTRAGGMQARFGYAVTTAATTGKVGAKVRATSKAGVAEATWEQPLQPPFEINRIAGNFSGDLTQVIGSRTARISWTGGATFLRNPQGHPGAFGGYTLTAGSVSFTYSGGYNGGDAVCDMSGNAFLDLFQHGSGEITVNPAGDPFQQGPQDYGVRIFTSPSAPTVTVTLSNCADSSLNGETRTLPLSNQPLYTGPDDQRSPDGIDYSGSFSESGSGVTQAYGWSMKGEK